jgi:predicted GNAT family acetyltransferase
MKIQQKQEGSKGSFFIEEAGRLLAEMTYSMTGTELMIIDHTEVSDELRGQNIGYQLVKTAVDFARANQLKILPLCTFAHSVFKKKSEEFGDVLRTN